MREHFPRILIGPLFNPGVIGNYLGHPCIQTFMSGSAEDFRPPYDLYYDIQTDTIASFLARLTGPQPDFLVWWDGVYQAIPPGIESCPIPTVLIPGDWNLRLSTLWPYLGQFDHVLADKALLQWMEKGGYSHGVFWPGFSFEPLKHRLLPDLERIYDLTFVGNLNHYVQRQRGFLLERLARLSDRYRVQICGGVYGEDYVKLLNQSKIVFNYTICQTMNMRAYEAPACGALLMIEAENLEVRDFLEDGVSCVLYTPANLESQIDHYLRHPSELSQIASAGQLQIQKFSYEKQFEWLIDHLIAFLKQRASDRNPNPQNAQETLLLQTRQLFRSSTPNGPLRAILSLNQHPNPTSAEQSNQLGVFLLHETYSWGPGGQLALNETFRCNAEEALLAFERAFSLAPASPVMGFNRAWCLELLRELNAAKTAYQVVYEQLKQVQSPGWEQTLPVYPERYTHFEVEWETRYRYSLPPQAVDLQPLTALLQWQVCLRLASLSVGSPAETLHWLIRALIAEPQLGEIPYLVALAWKKQGFPKRALSALQLALRNQPFQTRVWEFLLHEYIAQSQWDLAQKLLQSLLPIVESLDNLQAERPVYRRWQTLLTPLVLIQSAPSPEHNQAVFAALEALADPASAESFLAYYPQLKNQLHPDWHWLFINLELEWKPSLPEPEPDLFPAFNRPTGLSPLVQIGLANNPPASYLRKWQAQTETGVISGGDLPGLFPQLPAAPFEIEGLIETCETGQRPLNLLILVQNPLRPEEKEYLTDLADWAQNKAEVSILLWSRNAEPDSVFLRELDRLFSATPCANITLLTDIQTLAQEASLLEQVQVLAGVYDAYIAWYYHWALTWGLPLWLKISPSELEREFGSEEQALLNLSTDWDQRQREWPEEKARFMNWAVLQKSRDYLLQLKRFQTAWKLRLDWIKDQLKRL
jgi:hypothetical protein